MSDQPPNTGPDRKTLLNLKAMLPSLFRGLADGSIGKRRKAAREALMVARPRRFCTICGKMWDRTFVKPDADTEIKPEQCAICEAKLKVGMIAFVCRDKFAFAESAGSLSDFRGQIVHVKPHVMEQIEAHFAGSVKTKEKSDDPT